MDAKLTGSSHVNSSFRHAADSHKLRQSIEHFTTANRMSTDDRTSSQCKPWCDCQLSDVGGEAQSKHHGPRPNLSPDRPPPSTFKQPPTTTRSSEPPQTFADCSYESDLENVRLSAKSDQKSENSRPKHVTNIYKPDSPVLNNTASARPIL